jgi:hypothetical protein
MIMEIGAKYRKNELYDMFLSRLECKVNRECMCENKQKKICEC